MHTLILFLAGLLAILLVWQAFRRPNRRRLAWRLVANLVAVAALVLLAINPSYQVPINARQAILLTEGASEDSLQNLLQSLPSQPSVWAIDTSLISTFTHFNVQRLPDLAYLHRHYPEVEAVHLLGYGLPPHDLPLLDSLRAIPHLSIPHPALAAIRWTEKVSLGEQVVLQGTYHNTARQPVMLRLEGFGTGLDSTEVGARQQSQFELRTTPKEPGRFVFTLQGRIGSELIFTEKTPFEVMPRQLLRVLILESFPTFQSKFLKTFLTQHGHTVAARAAISQGKYRTEFINTPSLPLHRLTPTLLDRFDLLIADAPSLDAFAQSEQMVLRNAVREGCGVLLLVSDEKLPGGNLWSPYVIQVSRGPDTQQIKPEWPLNPRGTTPIVAPPIHLRPTPSIRPLVRTERKQVVAGTHPYGLGHTSVVAAANTFEWILAGKNSVYASYWSYLLTATARRTKRSENWRIAPLLPVVEQPVTLQVATKSNNPPLLWIDSTTLYPQEVPSGSRVWEGTFWPRQGGWQEVRTSQGEPYYWYVYNQADWHSRQLHERYKATVTYLDQSKQKAKTYEPASTVRQEAVPAIWFYLLFLLSVGFLWLERKL